MNIREELGEYILQIHNTHFFDGGVSSYVDPVSTGFGESPIDGSTIPVFYPGLLSLAIPPCVGLKSTGDNFGHRWEKKRRVLRSPCYRNCWHTGILRASLIGSNPGRLKGEGGDLTVCA